MLSIFLTVSDTATAVVGCAIYTIAARDCGRRETVYTLALCITTWAMFSIGTTRYLTIGATLSRINIEWEITEAIFTWVVFSWRNITMAIHIPRCTRTDFEVPLLAA